MASSLAELLQDYFNLGQLESEIVASAIMEAFEKEGIAMPFPTQTIFLQKSEHS